MQNHHELSKNQNWTTMVMISWYSAIMESCVWCAKDDEDEDDAGRPRKVGFSLSEDFIEKEGKLQRRDTPHHLKNKRISSVTGKSAESEAERVRQILAGVATGNQPSTSATSDDADQHTSLKVVYLFFSVRILHPVDFLGLPFWSEFSLCTKHSY